MPFNKQSTRCETFAVIHLELFCMLLIKCIDTLKLNETQLDPPAELKVVWLTVGFPSVWYQV